jgi:hypothetical protein
MDILQRKDMHLDSCTRDMCILQRFFYNKQIHISKPETAKLQDGP